MSLAWRSSIAGSRLDCLKQAIDQNIVGPQRADFVKGCAG
jgi:hypothetical protein